MSWLNDPLTGRTVRFAPGRAERPSDFSRSNAPQRCPFCAGAEADTPDELDRVVGPDGEWLTRVVPNAYPIVTGTDGAHEVVIESPRHVQRFAELTEAEATAALQSWAKRIAWHRESGPFDYTLLFKNEGPAAGASLEHVHSQIVALPEAPPAVQRLWQAFPTAGIASTASHVVIDSPVRAVVPPAPRSPGEVWLLPGQEIGMDSPEVVQTLSKLLRAMGLAAFNLVLQVPPRSFSRNLGTWWLELVPRTASVAGFELATDCWINPEPPAVTADRLRGLLGDLEA